MNIGKELAEEGGGRGASERELKVLRLVIKERYGKLNFIAYMQALRNKNR